MMREILFRGKPVNKVYGNGFIYGSLGVIREGLVAIYNCLEFTEDIRQLIIPETVGQYTGLNDKNGTKIFEGDIVKYGDTINKVVFEQRNGTAYFGVVMDDTETWHFCHLTSAAGMEVIGNIHDNPELLESEVEGE
jgi:uncharacterized phage protein (TIGR01671 family)